MHIWYNVFRRVFNVNKTSSIQETNLRYERFAYLRVRDYDATVYIPRKQYSVSKSEFSGPCAFVKDFRRIQNLIAEKFAPCYENLFSS